MDPQIPAHVHPHPVLAEPLSTPFPSTRIDLSRQECLSAPFEDEDSRWASGCFWGAEEALGVDIEAVTIETLGDAAVLTSEPEDGINETHEITLPRPTSGPGTRSSLCSVFYDRTLTAIN
ncbi:hypothetical protein IMSHALPRED_002568 [Imshaugia aleurites]|uniref:Uncharacterized protein n=1 Tax=Imshaugia aleurites TaxID=172621 RepID=A0A8H3PJ34_9LECA|nr:hypothetical protein IMSHALPRED_002568 [Imshaugia aleurites]